MMKKVVVLMLATSLLMFAAGCGNNGAGLPPTASQDTAGTESSEAIPEPQIKVSYDLEVVQNDQEQVDNGHSPWQLDPLHVTMTFVSLQMYPQGIVGEFPIDTEDMEILESTDATSMVAVNSKKTPITRVYLERLIRQDDSGIWTVTGYDIDETRQPSIAGICLWDHKDKVKEVLGSDYTETHYGEAGHFYEPFILWEYPQGYSIAIGQNSNKVLQIIATAPDAETNLGAKIGDSARDILSLYRAKYEEPTSIHGGELPGVFKVENGQAMVFDFNMEDGLVNPPEAELVGPVERIILTYPEYLDDSF